MWQYFWPHAVELKLLFGLHRGYGFKFPVCFLYPLVIIRITYGMQISVKCIILKQPKCFQLYLWVRSVNIPTNIIILCTLTGQKYFPTKIFPYIFHIKPFIFKTFSWSHSLSDFHEIFSIKYSFFFV